jgi:hypothetical protein
MSFFEFLVAPLRGGFDFHSLPSVNFSQGFLLFFITFGRRVFAAW